ncbi:MULTISPECIES: hypothetical protein [unclassified Sphingomonas]|uniref:hypothetical protein n=1 Tax=unclassified Sphingomonas TaxID=196159 RepID=UPI001D10111B|nr:MULTISPECIES: hypothetical protein [unclassified Sphingomonas]MCC2980146.1 hypothetical protein [Sphingomonas sp. IC4-52]MCD2314897.1 hypothetical protein [Sphingomonas sp. IC-11]
MMRGPGATLLLARALAASAARDGLDLAVEEQGSTPWHSATFSGHRHALIVTATPAGAAASAWLETIGSLEVRLPGELLADLSVVQENERGGLCQARIEALTVERA